MESMKDKPFDLTFSKNQSRMRPSLPPELQDWVQELKQLHAQNLGPESWRMLGRAVMVVQPQRDINQNLIGLVAEAAALELIHMESAQLVELVLSGKAPTIKNASLIFLQPGEWSKRFDEEEGVPPAISEFRSKFKDYLSALGTESKFVFVITGESYSELDPTLRAFGCIDRRFLISRPTMPKIGMAFLESVGLQNCNDSLVQHPGKVGMLICDVFDDERRQGLVSVAMARRAYKESRKLDFSDLVHFAIHGSAEGTQMPETDSGMLRRVAVHEAGHALISLLDSNGRNIPDYISVLPGHEFRGVVADSYAYLESVHGKSTYEDARHKIRVSIGGRAAEEVVFGSLKTGAFGSRTDLVNASAWAKELVGDCGFSEENDTGSMSGSNLLVADGELTASERAYIEAMARKYLQAQYGHVVSQLNENISLLHSIVERLMKDPVLFQDDILEVVPQLQDNIDSNDYQIKSSANEPAHLMCA